MERQSYKQTMATMKDHRDQQTEKQGRGDGYLEMGSSYYMLYYMKYNREIKTNLPKVLTLKMRQVTLSEKH